MQGVRNAAIYGVFTSAEYSDRTLKVTLRGTF